jgi:hypothetical protein
MVAPAECPSRVKSGKAHNEHITSASPLKADIRELASICLLGADFVAEIGD